MHSSGKLLNQILGMTPCHCSYFSNSLTFMSSNEEHISSDFGILCVSLGGSGFVSLNNLSFIDMEFAVVFCKLFLNKCFPAVAGQSASCTQWLPGKCNIHAYQFAKCVTFILD